MTVKITIANQKGGVGKTTTAVHLAHGLVLEGKRVLLVDFDPQGQCATILGLKQVPDAFNFLVAEQPLDEVARLTDRANLHVILGDRKTSTAQTVLSVQKTPISYIYQRLNSSEYLKMFDFMVIDTSPSVGELQMQALWASDGVLIPCAVDYLASDGVFSIAKTLVNLEDEFNWQGKILGVLPTFYDEVTRESKATLNDLRDNFHRYVLNPIHRATILRECAVEGKTIFELAPRSRAAEQYHGLVNYILDWNEKPG
ncbi:MAG: ParA family protein [Anaerolineales bacterium]|jgi:chromosome partitioning protein